MDAHPKQPAGQPKKRLTPWVAIAIITVVALSFAAVIVLAAQRIQLSYSNIDSDLETPVPTRHTVKSTEAPIFVTETVLGGLSHPWDIAFLPDKTMLFSQRAGTLSRYADGKVALVSRIADVNAAGEGGLLGLALDPKFNSNRYVYTCFNSTKGGPDVRVVRWQLTPAVDALTDRTDIVTGIPANKSGRHSGCRLAFGPDGYIWIGTGDAAIAKNPQDPKSLGGKVLRVDRDGKAAPGNAGGAFDARIYSYGHRNVQGLVFLPKQLGGVSGYSVEHGSSIDDELNVLTKGNFGWDPDPAYTEANIPMTNTTKFPDAIAAAWKSGTPTQAPSGATAITGAQWKAWQGSIAIAMLKAEHLKILSLDNAGAVTTEVKVLTDRGRLRTVVEGPDGALYIATDNGSGDQIIKVTAKTSKE